MKKLELFGKVAVRLGFVRLGEVDKALKIQKELKEKHKPHKLIGIILLEMGALGTTELITLLKEMEQQRGGSAKRLPALRSPRDLSGDKT